MTAGVLGEYRGGVPVVPLTDKLYNYILNSATPRDLFRPNDCRTVIVTAIGGDVWLRDGAKGDAVVPEEDFAPDGNGEIGQACVASGASRCFVVDSPNLSACTTADMAYVITEWFE